MARLSRKATAKNVADSWRRVWAHKDAPKIHTNNQELHQAVKSPFGDNAFSSHLGTAAHLGLLTREPGPAIANGAMGYHYTLVASLDDGLRAIAKHFATGGNIVDFGKQLNGAKVAPKLTTKQAETVAVETNEREEPVAAVVGEDAPSPFASLRELRKNEPAALVEAARQYAHRSDFVIERLTEIEKLGVIIDREKVMAAIKLDRDDELEGIVKTLPFIDELLARAGQAEEWRNEIVSLRNELRQIRADKAKVERELAEQKGANTRLAEKMARDAVSRPTSTVLVG